MENNETNPITPVEDTKLDGKGQVETPTTQVVSKDGGQEPVITENDDKKVNYVKERVDRAKEQTAKNILKELGVENLEDAKKLVANGTKALDEVSKLKAKLEAQEKDKEIANKKTLLSKVLENEKVFDADALINYIDLEKVQVEDGEIKDSENIIASLKKVKPNFFGTFQVASDNYIKGQQTQKQTALDKQKSGNVVGAIDDYLKNILK